MKSKPNIAILAAFLSLLTGCGFNPLYKRPEIQNLKMVQFTKSTAPYAVFGFLAVAVIAAILWVITALNIPSSDAFERPIDYDVHDRRLFRFALIETISLLMNICSLISAMALGAI